MRSVSNPERGRRQISSCSPYSSPASAPSTTSASARTSVCGPRPPRPRSSAPTSTLRDRPPWPRKLSHPEAGLHPVGMKSYGRAPTFLAATGYEQVRSLALALAVDVALRAVAAGA
ncbi:hypothetical protein GBW32_31930 [Streptomyces tsukubensis]|nr:hypothetical protein GBW32_31930 [Streptomyces tsukubensis]